MEEIEAGVRRLIAPNPSPMTERGTNTWLVGARDVAVIDPGPDDPRHLAAILAAVEGARLTAILVTHAHRDHSPLAPRLAAATGAPVHGFGPPAAGRSALMEALAAEGTAGGGEGVDAGFAPDVELGDGAAVESGEWRLEALHTPGHFAGHLSFALGDLVFTGDHVMAWASSLISPPDGEVSAFLASCRRLRARQDRRFLPGHGGPVDAPAERLDWLVAHRLSREAEALAALGDGPATLASLARRVYQDVPEALLPAAERNLFAHLVDLVARGRVMAAPRLAPGAVFALA